MKPIARRAGVLVVLSSLALLGGCVSERERCDALADDGSWLVSRTCSSSLSSLFDEGNAVDIAADQRFGVFMVDHRPAPRPTSQSAGSARGDAVRLTRLDGQGGLLWTTTASCDPALVGDETRLEPKHLSLDDAGNSTVVGLLRGRATFGTTVIQSDARRSDVVTWFAARFDLDGNVIWAKTVANADNRHMFDMVGDKAGNIYITGWEGQLLSGPPNYNKPADKPCGGVFATKIDATGKTVWTTRSGGTCPYVPATGMGEYATWDAPPGHSIAVDKAGNVVIVGQFAGTVTFGGTRLTAAPPDKLANTFHVPGRAFMARLDTNGRFTSAVALPGDLWTHANSVVLHVNGHVTVSAVRRSWSQKTSPYHKEPYSVMQTHLVILRLSEANRFVWTVAAESDDTVARPTGLVLGADGSCYLTGVFVDGLKNPGANTYLVTGGSDGNRENHLMVLKVDTEGKMSSLLGRLAIDSSSGVAIATTADSLVVLGSGRRHAITGFGFTAATDHGPFVARFRLPFNPFATR